MLIDIRAKKGDKVEQDLIKTLIRWLKTKVTVKTDGMVTLTGCDYQFQQLKLETNNKKKKGGKK